MRLYFFIIVILPNKPNNLLFKHDGKPFKVEKGATLLDAINKSGSHGKLPTEL